MTRPSQIHLKLYQKQRSLHQSLNETTDLTIAAKETTMARSSARQQQQRVTLDVLARMAAADGFSPGAARPIQPAYPSYQN
jgi:hypothetical protein